MVGCVQGCPAVDLLIRTSGEHRLSDFLLWQSRFAQLVFSDALWPDYSFWNLLQALVQYQRSYPELQKLQAASQLATASTSSHSLQDGYELRQSSSQSHEGPKAETLTVSAGVQLHEAVCSDELCLSKQPAQIEEAEVDTSDSSTSSESGPASPNQSPARLAGLSGPDQQHYECLSHPSQQSCQACITAPNSGQQEQTNLTCGLIQAATISPVVGPIVMHDSKLLVHTLHADVDCRTTSLPSLSRRHAYTSQTDLYG